MHNRGLLSILSAVLFAFGFAICSSAQKSNKPVYLDPSKPVEVRVDDLVGRMTLEEKASQLVNQARAIPRLQVPEYDYWSEALHGVARAGIATVFPQPVGLAATFDVPAIHEMAVVISTEARAKHDQAVRAGRRDIMEGLDFWSPNINIFRDPRWGRGQETYGEDPFLTGKMGVAFVTGMQGDDPKYFRVVSTPKHFAVHSGPEPTRHTVDVPASKHDMEDTYLPAFRATVIEAKAQSVMCAYNRVNGQPACANDFLLVNQLRGAWKFNGYVVSDCDAVYDIYHGHKFTKSMAEAAAVSIKAGMDNECADFFSKATTNSDYVKFIDAVKQGLLSEKDLDTAVKRVFTARMRLGMFDPPSMVPYANTPESVIDSEPHKQLALKIARESMVLLKNDGVLPLATGKKVAMVGALADAIEVLHGNYYGTASSPVTALEGIRKQFSDATVTYAPGMNFLREPRLVPTSVLSTEKGQAGLKAEYFTGKEFEGKPAVVRVDKMVDIASFAWDKTSVPPPPGLADFSVRWSGFLTPAESGDYEIGVKGSMVRFWIDEKMHAEDWSSHDPSSSMKTMHLEKGHRYAVKVEYHKSGHGAKLVWVPRIADPVGDAVAAAQKADVVVAVVGITSELEGEEMKVEVPGFVGGDRTSLDLPQQEEELIQAVGKTGKPFVVVLMNGSALSVNWASEHANAIVDAWYPGQAGGTAIAETLAGTNNPAGRLPVTFYKGVDQLPPFEDYGMKNRTYRYFEGQPLYPFGYGLSYSKFEYSNLALSEPELNAGDALGVDVDVKNISDRDGDEVVELYLNFPNVTGAPLRALRGFNRIHLKAGEQQHVKFNLDPRDLSYVNGDGDRLVGAGDYMVVVGGGQPGTQAPQAQARLTIRGEQKLPE